MAISSSKRESKKTPQWPSEGNLFSLVQVFKYLSNKKVIWSKPHRRDQHLFPDSSLNFPILNVSMPIIMATVKYPSLDTRVILLNFAGDFAI